MRALRELSVHSPLRECGITKEEVRKRSKEAGLFTWNKPAYACLATRISSGTGLTERALRVTETAEAYLSSLGFTDFRIRMLDNAAKIQILEEQFPKIFAMREKVTDELRKYYDAVLLDMEARG